MNKNKFRVWSKDEKRWVTDFMTITASSGQPLIHHVEAKRHEVIHHVYEVEASDFVIQQCTGLVDLKGIEIYEGDVIKYCFKSDEHGEPEEWVDEVIFEKGSFGTPYIEFSDLFSMPYYSMLVVGNICEMEEELV